MATVILIGFSTSGKSHYLKKVDLIYPKQFSLLDSDNFVAADHKNHIYNIFLSLGRHKALELIERKETEFIQEISNSSGNILIAAGPFVPIRDGWDEFVQEKKPFIIYLDKSAETIYDDLVSRRHQQKKLLNTQNQNFGSWDLDVLVNFENGIYQDLSKGTAIANIQNHLNNIVPLYKYYGNQIFDSDRLRIDENESDRLLELILLKLKDCS